MKCAIYGAGSLGTVLGAYMTRGGADVELVNRNRAHVDALREKGAHITGTVDFSTPVRAIEPSMLQDLKKGKPCEIDAINGVVCEWGRKCGVPTPINDRIVEVVKKEQAGELPLEEKNIRFFDDLL